MPRPFGYVSPAMLRQAALRIPHVKKASYDVLEVSTAQRILDSGCGPGIDTVAMALLAPDNAMITGIDIDETMLAEADEYAQKMGVAHKVRHILADAYDLPFEDASFDACRAERLFQNIPENHDTDAVLNSHLRVLRPGGRIALLDTDFATASMDFGNVRLERKMMDYCARRLRPNGLIARHFYAMLKKAGLRDVSVSAFAVPMTNPDDSPFGRYLAEAALHDGHVSTDEAEQWVNTVEDLGRKGLFYASLNLCLVSGIKP